jgi:hypothetical protein
MKIIKIFLIATSIVGLNACSTMNFSSNLETSSNIEGIESYVKDWPELTETIQYLSYSEIHQKCGGHKPKGKESAKVFGCSEIDLMKKTCTIFLPTNYESWALAHEKEHCKGGDHDNILQDYHSKWLIYLSQSNKK